MNKNQDVTYKIRPAARLIHTIGRDLIGDSYAALVELVKNSYDAEASKVDINFTYKEINKKSALVISINDNGHGMDFDTIINKWLVPATNDKLKRKVSPNKNRKLQGRKGIGRFSASILGQEMTMTSIDEKGEKSTVVIDWRIFNTDDFLENIELLVEKTQTKETSGTFIELIAFDETEKTENEEIEDNKLSIWNDNSINTLINELRKLISPFDDFEEDEFKINLEFNNCQIGDFNNTKLEIETYPIIKLYDYRISGTIDNEGNAILEYENNSLLETSQTEKINAKYQLSEGSKYCGFINVDFRVFDRDPEAIDNLIDKGLINPVTKKYAGKNEAKRMLNAVYGAKVYKNKFRIRPYGTDGNDWLEKDKDRIQNFTQTVSNNQLVGFITIESEEVSHLEEKSARDGLKENEYFSGLKELSKLALKELELRRLTFRERSLKGRKERTSINDSVSDLFSFSDLSDNINTKLEQFNVTKENIELISSILKKEEKAKAGILENIQKTIAIYQGQATLGKIVSFILHEGRKPIQYLNSETTVLERYLKFYKATKEEEYLDEIKDSISGFRQNSKLISELFKRVNPLASQKRANKKDFNAKETINDTYSIFKQSLIESNIDFEIDCPEELVIYGWGEDLFTATTNLIENSIYWLNLSDVKDKKISISVSETKDSIKIDYIDNGPGISDNEIETDIIFEPGYSKKHNGTGLGLAIAGEAIERLNGSLKARKAVTPGAYFQIEIEKV
jgi:signal transduction histidine kinase